MQHFLVSLFAKRQKNVHTPLRTNETACLDPPRVKLAKIAALCGLTTVFFGKKARKVPPRVRGLILTAVVIP
jgi:hypothetical protein